MVLRLGTAAFGVLAVARPRVGLLVLAGLLPFSYALPTRVWSAHPFALSEALVLAWLAGYLARRVARPEAVSRAPDGPSLAAWLFGVVVLASCAVRLAVVQAWHDYPLRYAATFLRYLAHDYLTTVPDVRPWVEGHGFVTTAAMLLEGIALMLAVRALCRRDVRLERQIVRVVVTSGAGVAAVNLGSLAWVAATGEIAPGAMSGGELRWTAFIPSLNTSGAYFLLVLFPAVGLAISRWPRPVPVVAAAAAATLALVALWLTKTYAAIVAALVAVAAGLAWVAAVRTRVLTLRRAAIAAVAIAALAGAAVVTINPLGLLAQRAYLSLHLRVLFAETALRMWAAHPLFGAGIAQYAVRFQEFSSAELLRYYARADAHNYLLWIAAELGAFGLAAFLALLGAAVAQTWKRVRANPEDPAFMSLCAGLGAFMITWLGGQPLSVPVVAYTFWMLLGIAAYTGAAGGPKPEDGPVGRSSTWARGALAMAVVMIVASVPFRIQRAMTEIDFGRVSYGFYGWETEGLDIRYRWTGPRATLFFPVSVDAVDLPLRAGLLPSRLGISAFEVRIFVDRRRVGLVQLTDDRWQRVRVPGPTDGAGARFWRVDLEITPTWRPSDHLPGSTDRRALGVKVGEIEKAIAR